MRQDRLEQMCAHLDEGGKLGNGVVNELLAEVVKLRKALQECADDLQAEIEDRYPISIPGKPGRDVYPDMQRRYDRDMAPVIKARKLFLD